MNAWLLDGPFRDQEPRVVGADEAVALILVGRCTCCGKVAAVTPEHQVQRQLEEDGVVMVTYLLARHQPEHLARRDTVAYRVARSDHDTPQPVDVRELVPA